METILNIKGVGNYIHPQAEPEDCKLCNNADWGDVIIEDICGKCLHKKIKELNEYIENHNIDFHVA